MTRFVLSYATFIYWIILSLYPEIHLFDTLGFESFGRYSGLGNFDGRLDLGRGLSFLRIFFFTLARISVGLGRFGYSIVLLLVVVILGAQIGRLGEDGT